MNLYMVKYKQWNSYFSENYERERLSVGNNKYEAIAKVKETVSKDAREFAAEKISAVFGYEVKISGDGVQMCSTHFKELKQRICELEEEFQNEVVAYVDEQAIEYVTESINEDGFELDEYNSRVLLQFENPLLVLVTECEFDDEIYFSEHIENVLHSLNSMDLLTYKYRLNNEKILPETKHRHNAVIKLMDIVPDFQFQTAMSWLDLNRTINESMLDGEDNPYQEFLDAIKEIKEKYGDEVLQKVFDMGTDVVVQPAEITEVAKYIADGGDVDRVSELLEDDFFLVPYEQHKEGGMDLC